MTIQFRMSFLAYIKVETEAHILRKDSLAKWSQLTTIVESSIRNSNWHKL